MIKKMDFSGIASFFKNAVSEKNLNLLRTFFMGKWYPVWVAFSVLIGRASGLELYFVMLDFVLVSVALLVCDSLRPVLPNLITFLFRIPLEHSPGFPNYSTYYSGAKMVFFIIFASLFFVSLTYFYIRNKVFVKTNILKTPLFVPLAVFSLSFLTAGMFSGTRMKEDLGFSLLQVFVFFIVYLILYYGLKRENVNEIRDYFVYISAICAVVLIFEVIDVFLRVDGAMVNGTINKNFVDFGWGISNTCGSALSVLTPMCMLGAMNAKRRYESVIYFVIGTLTITAVYFTLARASVIVGTVGFIVCMITTCFAGNNKKTCRVATVFVVVIITTLIVVFKEELSHMFVHFINKGLDDSGRYDVWNGALENFKRAPIFGSGYFSLGTGPKLAKFIPRLAHNTFLQLMSSMGIFGLVSYLVYRAFTFIPFFKHFKLWKLVLLTSCAILVFESWLDNFIFWFSPTFVYNLVIIICILHCEQTKAAENAGAEHESFDATESADVPSTGDAAESENAESTPEAGIIGDAIIHDSPINDACTSRINL